MANIVISRNGLELSQNVVVTVDRNFLTDIGIETEIQQGTQSVSATGRVEEAEHTSTDKSKAMHCTLATQASLSSECDFELEDPSIIEFASHISNETAAITFSRRHGLIPAPALLAPANSRGPVYGTVPYSYTPVPPSRGGQRMTEFWGVCGEVKFNPLEPDCQGRVVTFMRYYKNGPKPQYRCGRCKRMTSQLRGLGAVGADGGATWFATTNARGVLDAKIPKRAVLWIMYAMSKRFSTIMTSHLAGKSIPMTIGTVVRWRQRVRELYLEEMKRAAPMGGFGETVEVRAILFRDRNSNTPLENGNAREKHDFVCEDVEDDGGRSGKVCRKRVKRKRKVGGREACESAADVTDVGREKRKSSSELPGVHDPKKKPGRCWKPAGPWVLCLLWVRTSEMRYVYVERREAPTLVAAVAQHVAAGTTVCTETAATYSGLAEATGPDGPMCYQHHTGLTTSGSCRAAELAWFRARYALRRLKRPETTPQVLPSHLAALWWQSLDRSGTRPFWRIVEAIRRQYPQR